MQIISDILMAIERQLIFGCLYHEPLDCVTRQMIPNKHDIIGRGGAFQKCIWALHSLDPGRCGNKFKGMIIKLIIQNNSLVV